MDPFSKQTQEKNKMVDKKTPQKKTKIMIITSPVSAVVTRQSVRNKDAENLVKETTAYIVKRNTFVQSPTLPFLPLFTHPLIRHPHQGQQHRSPNQRVNAKSDRHVLETTDPFATGVKKRRF
jgi:hypothetical protein